MVPYTFKVYSIMTYTYCEMIVVLTFRSLLMFYIFKKSARMEKKSTTERKPINEPIYM